MNNVTQFFTLSLILTSFTFMGCDENYKNAVKGFTKMTGTKVTDTASPKKGSYSPCVETLFNKIEKRTGGGADLYHVFNVFKDNVAEIKINTVIRDDVTTETKDVLKLLEIGQAPDYDYIETVDYEPYTFNAYKEKSLGSTFNDQKSLDSTIQYDRSTRVLTLNLERANTTKNVVFHGVYSQETFEKFTTINDVNGESVKTVTHSKPYVDGTISCSSIDLKKTIELIQNN